MEKTEIAVSVSQSTSNKPSSRLRGWVAFFLSVLMLWFFMFYAGPWIRDSIPMFKKVAQISEEQDIDTTGFFYSDNKEFYEAERFLRESMELKQPDGYGFNGQFIVGILSCLAILTLGFKLMTRWDKPSEDDAKSGTSDVENKVKTG